MLSTRPRNLPLSPTAMRHNSLILHFMKMNYTKIIQFAIHTHGSLLLCVWMGVCVFAWASVSAHKTFRRQAIKRHSARLHFKNCKNCHWTWSGKRPRERKQRRPEKWDAGWFYLYFLAKRENTLYIEGK